MRLERWKIAAAAAFVAVAALHLSCVPRTIWEYDESFFTMAVERYQPLLHHPPPPGYPLYILFAKMVAVATGPFAALLLTSVLATLGGFIAWMAAFRAMSDSSTAVIAAVLLYASPAILVSGTLPQSDAGALALLGLAAYACARANPYAIALACAAAIGWRLQLSVAVVPMFLAAVLLLRTWRDRIVAIVTFGVACLAWLVPLVVATGGPRSYWAWLSGQAAYYAAHDASLSRSGHSAAQIALRFLAHPWGPKWLSLPLLALAAGGATLTILRRNARLIPLASAAIVYLVFALATMDPADAVRYAIPALPLIALLAACGASRSAATTVAALVTEARAPGSRTRAATRVAALLDVPSRKLAAPLLAILYAIGAYWYAMPILRTRATTAAPPAAAAGWIRANVPRSAIVLHDDALRPHAEYLLRGWRSLRHDAGVDTRTPVVIYADGERGDAPGVTFRWPDTDAYRKLTRNHYGAVSVIALPTTERFHAVEGVFAPERTRDGKSWRWISERATIELPDAGATAVRIVLRAPPEYPLDENRVRIDVHGRSTWLTVQRDATSEAVVPIPQGPVRITFTPQRAFVPARIAGANNRDTRTLSVMLTKVEQIVSPRSAPPAPLQQPPRRQR